MAKLLNDWLNFKYRERTIKSKASDGNLIVRNLTPVRSTGDYVFLPYREDRPKKVNFVVQYALMRKRFVKLVKRLEYSNDITLHKFRHFVYTTIDGLGLNQFAEYFIGHSNSPYWAKPEQEKIKTFRTIEPYLTFLDVTAMEARTADQDSRIDQLTNELELIKKRELVGAQVYVELLGSDPSKLPPNLRRFVDFYKKIADYNRSAGGSPMPGDPRFGNKGL